MSVCTSMFVQVYVCMYVHMYGWMDVQEGTGKPFHLGSAPLYPSIPQLDWGWYGRWHSVSHHGQSLCHVSSVDMMTGSGVPPLCHRLCHWTVHVTEQCRCLWSPSLTALLRTRLWLSTGSLHAWLLFGASSGTNKGVFLTVSTIVERPPHNVSIVACCNASFELWEFWMLLV